MSPHIPAFHSRRQTGRAQWDHLDGTAAGYDRGATSGEQRKTLREQEEKRVAKELQSHCVEP